MSLAHILHMAEDVPAEVLEQAWSLQAVSSESRQVVLDVVDDLIWSKQEYAMGSVVRETLTRIQRKVEELLPPWPVR
jgi:hypothetical protein